MYSPDISKHSPRLYRLGKHYGKPMTQLADQLIAFGLQRLGEVFPAALPPVSETVAVEVVSIDVRRSA